MNTEWYVANLIMEIVVAGATKNVVHENITLIHATTPNEAFEKAQEFGRKAESSYNNPQDQLVVIRFRGLAQLELALEEFYDGGELTFEEHVDVPEERLELMIPPKSKLRAFSSPTPGGPKDPDYRSAEVMRMAIEEVKKQRKGD